MKLGFKSALAAVLIGAAGSAFAQTGIPTAGPVAAPGAGAGGVVLEIFDTTTNVYETVWLGSSTTTGFNLTSFGGPAEAAAGRTLDWGVIGGASGANAFSTLFSAAEVTAGHVQFTVSAVNDGTPATPIVDATISTLGTVRNSALSNIATQASTAISSVFNAATGCSPTTGLLNPCVATSTTAATYMGGAFGATLGGFVGTSAAGTAGGAALNFYQFTGTGGTATTAVTPVQFANTSGVGTWTLSATGDLVYSVPGGAAVPLPAAVWLFGSGLLGLAGIGRRKLTPERAA